MFVVCPSCCDVFKIQAAHLSAAQGRVRCGGCHTLFDATACLFETRQAAAEAAHRFEAAGREIGGLVENALARMDVVDPVTTATVPAAPAAVPVETARFADMDLYANPVIGEMTAGESLELGRIKESLPEPQYEFPHTFDEEYPAPAGLKGRTLLAAAACLLLVVGLSGQYIWKQRFDLAASEAWRPWLERYCSVLGCELPLRHDIARLEILEREVRNHPRVKDALLISATFENEAAFTQAWPVFEVTFSDVSGTAVAVRRFTPDEYLPSPTEIHQGMSPGEKTRLILEVVDPGKTAVSYQFAFL